MPKHTTNSHMDTTIQLDDNSHQQKDEMKDEMKEHPMMQDKEEDKRRQARTFDERDIVCSLLF